jgi:hypothetical protein
MSAENTSTARALGQFNRNSDSFGRIPNVVDHAATEACGRRHANAKDARRAVGLLISNDRTDLGGADIDRRKRPASPH